MVKYPKKKKKIISGKQLIVNCCKLKKKKFTAKGLNLNLFSFHKQIFGTFPIFGNQAAKVHISDSARAQVKNECQKFDVCSLNAF